MHTRRSHHFANLTVNLFAPLVDRFSGDKRAKHHLETNRLFYFSNRFPLQIMHDSNPLRKHFSRACFHHNPNGLAPSPIRELMWTEKARKKYSKCSIAYPSGVFLCVVVNLPDIGLKFIIFVDGWDSFIHKSWFRSLIFDTNLSSTKWQWFFVAKCVRRGRRQGILNVQLQTAGETADRHTDAVRIVACVGIFHVLENWCCALRHRHAASHYCMWQLHCFHRVMVVVVALALAHPNHYY